MTTKTKDKPEETFQKPGPKKPLRLSVPDRGMPHDDLIKPLNSIPSETRQAIKTSQPSTTSQVQDQAPARSKTSQPSTTSQVTQAYHPVTEVDLMASLPDVKGFLRLYFQLVDHLYPQLDPFERAIHETLYRLSWGFNKSSCTISYQRLAERTNMSHKSAQRAVAKLEQKKLISKEARIIGYGKDQGIEFRVVPPPRLVLEARQATQTRQVSETPIIDNIHETNTQTQAGVGVASRFSLEECRLYANHLAKTGQGITNPGGYATTIYRTGEADTMIEVFLNPNPPLDQIDFSKCPDCSGTGFYYPNGLEKGVAKCQHKNL